MYSRSRVRILLGLLLAASFLGVAPEPARSAPDAQMHAGSGCLPTPPTPPAGESLTRYIEARVGQPFSITLDANPTTGYSWALALPLDTNVVELLQRTYRRAGGAGMGAGGTAIWTFEPLCVGFTTIVLKYRRPWEPDDPNDRQEAYDIYIRD